MSGQADPWEMTGLLKSLKRHWGVTCNGGSQGRKEGISRYKFGVPPIPNRVICQKNRPQNGPGFREQTTGS